MPYKLYLYSYSTNIPFSATSYYWVAKKKRCGIKQEQRRARTHSTCRHERQGRAEQAGTG